MPSRIPPTQELNHEEAPAIVVQESNHQNGAQQGNDNLLVQVVDYGNLVHQNHQRHGVSHSNEEGRRIAHQALSTSSNTVRRHSVDSLQRVVELGQSELNQCHATSSTTSSESLMQTLIDTINNEEENRKKRKRETHVEGNSEHVDGQMSIWDIIPQQFTHVKLHANEIPSTEFCKIMFLYAWAYSKYLVHQQQQEHADSSPTSPILSQDGSSDDSVVHEPHAKKVAHSNPNESNSLQ